MADGALKVWNGKLLRSNYGKLLTRDIGRCVTCADCAGSRPTVVLSVAGSACTEWQTKAAGTYAFKYYAYLEGSQACIWRFERTFENELYLVEIWFREPKAEWPAQWEAYVYKQHGYYTMHLFSRIDGSECGGVRGYHCVAGQLVFTGMMLETAFYPGTDCRATLTTV